MICEFEGDVCKHCGWVIPERMRRPVVRECEATWQAGDELEKALSAIGVTQERWKALKGWLGAYPHCNCDKRKAWLNKASADLQVKLHDLKHALEAYYARPR